MRPLRKSQPKLRPQLAVDVFYTVFNTRLLWVLIGSALLETWILISHHALSRFFGITDLVVIRLDGLPMWARFAVMYLFIDLLEYLKHWLTHRVNFLWEFHKVHHSSQQIDIWNANRFHFTEFLFGSYYAYFLMALVGFPTQEVFIGSLILALTNIYSHANINLPLGPLKYIINNPQLHIWHHSVDIDARKNVNYGDGLSIWDYLLGTAYLPPDREADRLGFDDIDAYPTSYLGQLIQPFIEIASSIRNKLKLAG